MNLMTDLEGRSTLWQVDILGFGWPGRNMFVGTLWVCPFFLDSRTIDILWARLR